MSYIKSRKRDLSHPAFTRTGLSTAIIAGLMSTTGYAAPATPSSDNIVLPEVSVSGSVTDTKTNYHQDELSSSKFTQPISRTPQTIQVIDSQIIHDQHATTLTEALRNSPGVGVFFAGENGNTNVGDGVFMRGFDSSGSIFSDGIRDIGSVSRDTFNTEQVEVIKGSNGTNYGRATPGGSINMATKQATWNNSVNGNISVGTDHQRRTTFDVNRQINDTTAVRLNVMGEDSDVAGRDWVENKKWGIAPAITFGLGTDKRLKINYLHVSQNNRPDGGASTVGLPHYDSPDAARPELANLPKPKSSNFYGTKGDFDDITQDSFTVLYEQDLADGKTFHNTTRWARIDQKYRLSAIMTRDPSAWIINNPDSFNITRLPNFKDQSNTIITNQMGIVQEGKTGSIKHTVSYGLDLSREQVKTTDIRSPLAPDGSGGFVNGSFETNLYHPDHNDPNYFGVKSGASGKGTIDTAGVYLFDSIEINDHWQVHGGVRLDHYKIDFKNTVASCGVRGTAACTTNAYTVGEGVDASISKNLFSWQTGVVYQINEQGNIYADYAVASQPPGGNNIELSSSATSVNNSDYDPQEAKTAEIGTKWSLMNNNLLLTAALYHTTVDNQIDRDTTPVSQDGKKTIKGIELSAIGRVTDNLNLSVGATKMDAKIDSGSVEANDGSDGLPYTPSYAFTSWATYKLPFGLTIGGGARFNGSMKRGSDGAVGTPDKTKSYWVTDAMASYPISQNLDLQLNVYNVFNKEYVASINKSGYRYTPGTPRTAILSANYRF